MFKGNYDPWRRGSSVKMSGIALPDAHVLCQIKRRVGKACDLDPLI